MPVRLENPRGSVLQFAAATLPFLVLIVYFMYEAALRPSKPLYDLDDAVDEDTWNKARDESGDMIPLADMVTCILVLFGAFSTLAVYIIVFVPMRRGLMKRYLEDGQVVLGDVDYKEERGTCDCRFLANYAFVSYSHPEVGDSQLIRKKVRVYEYFSKEKTTILYLPGKPYSGQPKSDVEFDLAASSDARDQTRHIAWICLVWMVFTLASTVFIILQMSRFDDPEEDQTEQWTRFGWAVGFIVPMVAIGGNALRWLMRRYWLLHSCTIIDVVDNNKEETPYQSMEAA